MLCRFENRLSGQALELLEFSHRIAAHAPSDLPAAFSAISRAQRQGRWIALLLEYELGEWLEPAFSSTLPLAEARATPALTALVYRNAQRTAVWPAPQPDAAGIELDTRPLIARDDYLNHVNALRQGIGRGDFYQTNYTFPIQVRSATTPLRLYQSIAARHPAAHAAYIDDSELERRILSFSPELFVARQGNTLTVRPMKGTAPRHQDHAKDERLGQELLQSEKNRAENLMIVDLLRNDLGRIAVPGTVSVDALFSLERYPSVWTLTSTVRAQAPAVGLETMLRALFPCGSITGAPKIAAMKKIKELEGRPRGIYCGSVGWLAPNGDCSLNVSIRTIEIRGEHDGIFGVGGGIVYDSDPEQEWEECLWKARILSTQQTKARQ